MANVKELGNGKYRVIVSNGFDGTGKRVRKSATIEAKSLERAKLIAEQMECDFKYGKTFAFETRRFNALLDEYEKEVLRLDGNGNSDSLAVSP
ncbi:MAG: hypothetical protein ACI4SS_00720 [Clostridia bacterium]